MTDVARSAMITVTPTRFSQVEYDPDEIATHAAEALAAVAERHDELGADTSLDLQVAEDEATSRIAIASLEPLVFSVDGGAIEDYRDPRRLGGLETRIVVTRLLLEVLDRRSVSFGAPPLDAEIDRAHRQAWDVNLYGRVARHGFRLHKPRFVYNFRNRHGFTDHADRTFEQLWSSDDLTWSAITELSDQARTVPS